MDLELRRSAHEHASLSVKPRMLDLLNCLLEAYEYAYDVGQATWDFAVEIEPFMRQGLTVNDLRWLICKGLVEHACEVTLEGEHQRSFRPLGKLGLTARTCAVLTSTGADLMRLNRTCE